MSADLFSGFLIIYLAESNLLFDSLLTVMVGRIMTPKDIHIPIPEAVIVTLYGTLQIWLNQDSQDEEMILII